MTEAFPPEQFLGEVQRRHDEICSRGYFDREAGLVKAIKRTSGALAGEFGRLEALYKTAGELFIPHGEKAKLYELAVDTAALSMLLCENSVQSRRQAQLILEKFSHTEDVEKLTEILDDAAKKVKVEREQKDLEEQLAEAQRAKEEAEKNAAELQEEVKVKTGRKAKKDDSGE